MLECRRPAGTGGLLSLLGGSATDGSNPGPRALCCISFLVKSFIRRGCKGIYLYGPSRSIINDRMSSTENSRDGKSWQEWKRNAQAQQRHRQFLKCHEANKTWCDWFCRPHKMCLTNTDLKKGRALELTGDLFPEHWTNRPSAD